MTSFFKKIFKNHRENDNFCFATSDLIFALSLIVFIFFRAYHITQSLNFQNDIGRDYLRLIEWKKSGKPPLLGPQDSAIPFNQSVVYFYMFYPLFLISNMSFLTTFSTRLGLHLAVLIGAYLF